MFYSVFRLFLYLCRTASPSLHQSILLPKDQWTIYSATTFLEKYRKVVLEKWFCKLRFFFWSTTFLEPDFLWIYGTKPSFFLVIHFSRTRFLKPYFLNQISKKCKNRACRIKGWVVPDKRQKVENFNLKYRVQI